MDEEYIILRLLEKAGPQTTVRVSDAIQKSRYATEIRLLRLKPPIRELSSKAHGPSIWWFPSLYEYLRKVAELRLISLGYAPKKQPGSDFYGEDREGRIIAGFCSTLSDQEGLVEEFEACPTGWARVLMTDRPPEKVIKGVNVWTLLDIPSADGITFIPIESRMLFNQKKKYTVKEYTNLLRRGLDVKDFGL